MNRKLRKVAQALVDGTSEKDIAQLIREVSSTILGGSNQSHKNITNPINKAITNKVNHKFGGAAKGDKNNSAFHSVNTHTISKPPKGTKSPLGEHNRQKSLFDYTMYGGIKKRIGDLIKTEDNDEMDQGIEQDSDMTHDSDNEMSNDSDYMSCLQELLTYIISASSSNDNDIRIQVLSIIKDAVDDVSNMISSGDDISEINSSCSRWKELAHQTLHQDSEEGQDNNPSDDEVAEPEIAVSQ